MESLPTLLWTIFSGSKPFRPKEQLLSTEGATKFLEILDKSIIPTTTKILNQLKPYMDTTFLLNVMIWDLGEVDYTPYFELDKSFKNFKGRKVVN